MDIARSFPFGFYDQAGDVIEYAVVGHEWDPQAQGGCLHPTVGVVVALGQGVSHATQ